MWLKTLSFCPYLDTYMYKQWNKRTTLMAESTFSNVPCPCRNVLFCRWVNLQLCYLSLAKKHIAGLSQTYTNLFVLCTSDIKSIGRGVMSKYYPGTSPTSLMYASQNGLVCIMFTCFADRLTDKQMPVIYHNTTDFVKIGCSRCPNWEIDISLRHG